MTTDGLLFAIVVFVGLVLSVYVLLEVTVRHGISDYGLPMGVEIADLARRRRWAIGASTLAVAVFSAFWTLYADAPPIVRAAAVANAALMAAAGAMDIWRFKLPLPLTLVGILLSLIVRLISGETAMLLIGLVGGAVLCIVWALLTRGRIGGGDYLAILWIMIALASLGLIAILIGQICILVFHLRKTKSPVPVGGMYLLCASALTGLISLPAFPIPAAAVQPRPTSAAVVTVKPVKLSDSNRFAGNVSSLAGDAIARVGIAPANQRQQLAIQTAASIDAMGEQIATVLALDAACDGCTDLLPILSGLSSALNQYQTDQIASLSVLRAAHQAKYSESDALLHRQ